VNVPHGVLVATSPEEAIAKAKDFAAPGATIWIIGGAELYRMTLPLCDEVRLTKVDGVHEGDAALPAFEGGFSLVEERRGERCSFLRYARSGALR
jgi:dihydrofolate reductase